MSYENFLDKHFPNISERERCLLLTTKSISNVALGIIGLAVCGVGVIAGGLYGGQEIIKDFLEVGTVPAGFTIYWLFRVKENFANLKASSSSKNNTDIKNKSINGKNG